MSIRINKEKCTSCGKCADVCPGNLICRDKEGKAFMKYPKECWGCTACLKECPAQAIQFYLAKDMGGRGGYLYVSQENKKFLEWHITDKNGKKRIIRINRKESNSY